MSQVSKDKKQEQSIESELISSAQELLEELEHQSTITYKESTDEQETK